MDPSQIPIIPQQTTFNQFSSFNFHDTNQTNLQRGGGLLLLYLEKIAYKAPRKLSGTRGHNQLQAVFSVTLLCDFTLVLVSPSDVSPFISAPIVGFVQSDDRTMHLTTILFPDDKWAPVPFGLADHPDFLWYKSNAESNAGPLDQAFLVRRAGIEQQRPPGIERKSPSNPSTLTSAASPGAFAPTDCTSVCRWTVCRWRRKPREQNAELDEKQRRNKLGSRIASLLQTSHPFFGQLVSQHSF